MTDPQKYDSAGIPLATLAGPDPGNTDPDKLTAPLDPDDDVHTLLDEQDEDGNTGD